MLFRSFFVVGVLHLISSAVLGLGGLLAGGLATSFAMELLVYPAIYWLWKWHTEVKHSSSS